MTTASPSLGGTRVVSVDAYRGLVMLLMLGEVLSLRQVARAYPESGFWAFLADQQSHVEWVGCSLHDLIQPSFTFLVGVALVFSIANRRGRGQTLGVTLLHAAWRSLVLVFLGIFLRSINRAETNFTFEDTLTQIGLGYFLLVLIGLGGPRVHWGALAFILVGYWLAFALYPLPGPAFDWQQTGVDPNWEESLSGFAAHWNKNTNLAWAFDRWFLNQFPRETPFLFNGGGYATLSFIPTLGTMVLGVIAGTWLRGEERGMVKVRRLFLAGVVGLAAGWLLGWLGVCPVVKRIWTPSWVLFSGGWCFLFLAGFYAVMDVAGVKAWGFPLVVVGMNSIFAYVSEWLFVDFLRRALDRHIPEDFFTFAGAGYAPLIQGICVLAVLWGMLFWLYRRKVFLRI